MSSTKAAITGLFVCPICYTSFMNEWSIHRKRVIMGLILLALVILLGIPVALYFHKAPSCSDGVQNGDETGVDCGGSCSLICPDDSLPMLFKGDPQVLPITSSTYDVVAYVQNPNATGEVTSAPYTITLYDASTSAPVSTIQGSTYIPPASTFALFSGPLFFATSTPTHATFTWGNLVYKKNINPVPQLTIENTTLLNASTSPRIEATVLNDTLQTVSNVELVALIFDENGTIVHASRTVLESLAPGESQPIVYTWPAPFVGTTTVVEIIPRIFPDASYIK
jgi:hypothetical protein